MSRSNTAFLNLNRCHLESESIHRFKSTPLNMKHFSDLTQQVRLVQTRRTHQKKKKNHWATMENLSLLSCQRLERWQPSTSDKPMAISLRPDCNRLWCSARSHCFSLQSLTLKIAGAKEPRLMPGQPKVVYRQCSVTPSSATVLNRPYTTAMGRVYSRREGGSRHTQLYTLE